MLSRLGPPLTLAVLAAPALAGLAGTLLPAFGYLPAIGGDALSLDPFRQLLVQPGIGRSALLSLAAGVATAAAALTTVMLFLAAWAGTPAFSRLQHLVSPLLSVPHAAAAFGLAFLIAPSGMAARLVSPWLTGWERPPDALIVNDPAGLAMMAGLAAKEIPFLLLIALAALPQADLARRRRLAASLGYGRIAGFLFGTWPSIYRQIRLAVFAVIAFSSSAVDVAIILGPTRPATLAVRLVGWMNDPELTMRFLASAGAVLQLGVTAAALALWIGLEHAGAWLRDRAAAAGLRLRRDRPAALGALAAMTGAALAVFAGLATLAVWSVAGLWQFPDALPSAFTARSWEATLPRIAAPLGTTLTIACAATLAATALALLCLAEEDRAGRRRIALALVYLPLIVPQVAFLFGLQLLFGLSGAEAGLPALVLAHLVFVMPYVLLSLSDPWRAFDRRYETVAHGLGHGRGSTLWRVKLPMLMRAVLIAAAIGFAVSIGQYLPTLLVGGGRLPTVTTEAVALASGGNRRVIGVYAFLQAVLPFLGFAVATALPALLLRRFRAMRA